MSHLLELGIVPWVLRQQNESASKIIFILDDLRQEEEALFSMIFSAIEKIKQSGKVMSDIEKVENTSFNADKDLLFVLGEVNAQRLLRTNADVSSLRQTKHFYGEKKIPMVVSYHPRDILRDRTLKRDVYADLMFAKNWILD